MNGGLCESVVEENELSVLDSKRRRNMARANLLPTADEASLAIFALLPSNVLLLLLLPML